MCSVLAQWISRRFCSVLTRVKSLISGSGECIILLYIAGWVCRGQRGRRGLYRDPLSRRRGGGVFISDSFPVHRRYDENRPGSLINLRCLRRQMCRIGVPQPSPPLPLQSTPLCMYSPCGNVYVYATFIVVLVNDDRVEYKTKRESQSREREMRVHNCIIIIHVKPNIYLFYLYLKSLLYYYNTMIGCYPILSILEKNHKLLFYQHAVIECTLRIK